MKNTIIVGFLLYYVSLIFQLVPDGWKLAVEAMIDLRSTFSEKDGIYFKSPPSSYENLV